MSERIYDVCGLGELLVDFAAESDQSLKFTGNPGGAPPNVLAQLSRLGKKTTFIGKVGDDLFGAHLRRALCETGIGDEGLVTDEEAHTTLAFVSVDSRGERSFSFARRDSADVRLRREEVRYDLIDRSRVFHIGTLSLTDEPARSATLAALERAKQAHCAISVDPNYRAPLWKSEAAARDAMRLALSYADIVKISDYEVEFLFGETSPEKGARLVAAGSGAKLVFVTCGEKGAFAFCAESGSLAFAPALSDCRPLDTTGAGDSFTGAALSRLIDLGLRGADFAFAALSESALAFLLRFANAAAGISTERQGAIPAMAGADEIAARLAAQGRV